MSPIHNSFINILCKHFVLWLFLNNKYYDILFLIILRYHFFISKKVVKQRISIYIGYYGAEENLYDEN